MKDKIYHKKNKKYCLASIAGAVAGIISGFVKFGWEVPFPPRTEDREVPPAILLDKMGINSNDLTYTFSDQTLNYGNFIVHFAFSIATSMAYCILAEKYPKIKFWKGTGAGLISWIGAHLISLPAMKLTPPANKLPLDEHLSELFGHLVWFWTIEIVRRQIVKDRCER